MSKTRSNLLCSTDPLPPGYLARHIYAELQESAAVTVRSLALSLPEHFRRDGVEPSVAWALKTETAKGLLVKPMHGVYGLASDPPTWVEVMDAHHALYGFLARHLSRSRGQTAEALAALLWDDKALRRLGPVDVARALRAMKTMGLTYKMGRQWGANLDLHAPCAPATSPKPDTLEYLLS